MKLNIKEVALWLFVQKGYFLESGKKGNEDVTSKIIKPMAGKWKSGGIF